MNNKKAQIWVETAIYTLIGLTIIAILLSIAGPQIEKIKDKGIIQQTAEAMNILNDKILESEQSTGSIRVVDFKVGKGKLEIDPASDSIIYTLENTRLELSQPGVPIQEGPIILETFVYGSRYNIILTMDYSSSLNITYDGFKNSRILQAGTTPYKIQIENMGTGTILGNPKVNMDFSLI